MDLKVIIQNCVLVTQGNFFMVVQIDELQYTSKEKKTQKFRSEVQFTNAHPQFRKNVFQFTNLSYGDRVTLKVGCFNTRLTSEPQEQRKLLEHSILFGTMQLVLTVKLLEVLRIEGQLQHESLLYDPEDQRKEKGRISILLRHQSHDLKAQVEDDVERIEEIYYDPFEKDEAVIRRKLQRVELKLTSLNLSMEPIQKKLNFIRTAHKQISFDLATLRQQKDQIEEENNYFQKIVNQKNDVKELHIQIDLLCNTDYGQDILKKKLVLLMNKLEFERRIYHELSNHYYQIESAHTEAKTKTQELQTLKETIQEQDFLIKRLEDQRPILTNLKETMENQENIILSLQDTIKETSKNLTRLDKQQLFYNLDKLRADQQLLKQKQVQLQHISEMNKGEIPRSFFEQFKNDEFFRDNPIIVSKFQKRAEMLLKEIELLQEGLAETRQMPIQQSFRPKSSGTSDNVILQLEIQQAENKAEILEEQMLAVARNYAKQIADLKAQLNIIEAQLR
ncbi:unnamed protein product [Paramecium octaurelia]|uniref:Uncharacterized protein n=1 Tax=Paramecium octaurelia TaxID=43137 RepID=A0A8S1YAT0_PAROT|nr:unnamed protein product [Paramecium octaurelia]